MAHGLSCSAARGILPDQGPNPCPLHWQADSQPLRHQGSPVHPILKIMIRKGKDALTVEIYELPVVPKKFTKIPLMGVLEVVIRVFVTYLNF